MEVEEDIEDVNGGDDDGQFKHSTGIFMRVGIRGFIGGGGGGGGWW